MQEMRKTEVQSLGQEDPLEEEMASHSGKLIIFFAVKVGETLHSQQKQDLELTVAQIMSSLLPNSDLNRKK